VSIDPALGQTSKESGTRVMALPAIGMIDKEDSKGAQSGPNLVGAISPPAEPFPCPNCGQMLAPTCRVCVACRQPIDFGQIAPVQIFPPAVPTLEGESLPQAIGHAHFSWPIFLIVLIAALSLVSVAIHFLGVQTTQLVFVGIAFVCAGAVYLDAHSRKIPRAWRWSIMTLFFWIAFFPWYLSRRRFPHSPCPIIEAETSILFRALIWFIVIMLFLSFIAAMLKGPGR
jgi:hypothetical protein